MEWSHVSYAFAVTTRSDARPKRASLQHISPARFPRIRSVLQPPSQVQFPDPLIYFRIRIAVRGQSAIYECGRSDMSSSTGTLQIQCQSHIISLLVSALRATPLELGGVFLSGGKMAPRGLCMSREMGRGGHPAPLRECESSPYFSKRLCAFLPKLAATIIGYSTACECRTVGISSIVTMYSLIYRMAGVARVRQ